MKLSRTTLPLRSLSDSGAPSWVVSASWGAAPIRGRPDGWPGRRSVSEPGGMLKPWTTAKVRRLTIARGSRVVHDRVRYATISRPFLALQLLLQLVEERPVGARADDLLGAGFDHADLVQAERVEPDRVFGIVLAPAIVGNLLHRLEGVAVVPDEAAIDHLLGCALRLGSEEHTTELQP